jgi:DNA-binding GntR family transcriptional regulator
MPIPHASSTPRVQRRLLRDEARDAIRAAILDGSFKPGEILDDASLQDWLGVSRSPIRDALRALEFEGLVKVQAQSGTRVAIPDPQDVEDGLQAMGAVMGGAMRITVPTLSEGSVAQLVSLVDRCISAVMTKDNASHLEAALGVYDLILEHCPNKILAGIARSSMTPLTFGYRASIETRIPNWELLRSGWTTLRRALLSGDNVVAELAFEEMHRLPLPDEHWDPAEWRTRGE